MPNINIPPSIDKHVKDFEKLLHQPGLFTNVLAKVEQKTGVKRLYIVAALLVLHALYLLFGRWAQLVCNMIGFLYPAVSSIKAIETKGKDDDTQWLTYWVMFALFSVLEFFSRTILYYFPFYWLGKCLFCIYLYTPSTRGATQLYAKIVRPVFGHYYSSIEKKLNGSSSSGQDKKWNGGNGSGRSGTVGPSSSSSSGAPNEQSVGFRSQPDDLLQDYIH